MPSRPTTYYESIKEGHPAPSLQSNQLRTKKQSSKTNEKADRDRNNQRINDEYDVSSKSHSRHQTRSNSHNVEPADNTKDFDQKYTQFYFKERFEDLDWRTLLHIDIEKVIRDQDLDTLESISSNITFGKIHNRDLKFLNEENVLHVFQLSQLIIEYLLYVQQYLVDKKQTMENDIQAVLNQLENYKQKADSRKEDIANYKKEIRRQKRTIFAYQLVFGANPEKARSLLQSMRDGKVEMPTSNAQPYSKPSPTVMDQINLQLQQLKDDNTFLKQQIRELTSSKNNSATSSVLEKKVEEFQRKQDEQAQTIDNVNKALQNLKNKKDMELQDLQIMNFVENKLKELLPTLQNKEERNNVLRLSHNVKELSKQLSDSFVRRSLQESLSTSDENVEEDIDVSEAQIKSEIGPIAQSESQQAKGNTDVHIQNQDSNAEALQEELKPLHSVKSPTQISRLPPSPVAMLSKNKQLYAKINKEMNLSHTLEIYDKNKSFRIENTAVSSRFQHKKEDFDLQKEIVCYEFDNFLKKRKLDHKNMSQRDFVTSLKRVSRCREDYDPELRKVLTNLNDIVDGICMVHNPNWKKFFQKSSAQKFNYEGKKRTSPQNTIKISDEFVSRLNSNLQSRKNLKQISQDLSLSHKRESKLQIEPPVQYDNKRLQEHELPYNGGVELPSPIQSPQTQPTKIKSMPIAPPTLRATVSTSFTRSSKETFVTSSYESYATSQYSDEETDEVDKGTSKNISLEEADSRINEKKIQQFVSNVNVSSSISSVEEATQKEETIKPHKQISDATFVPVLMVSESTDVTHSYNVGIDPLKESTVNVNEADKKMNETSTKIRETFDLKDEWRKQKEGDIKEIMKQLHGTETNLDESLNNLSEDKPIQIVSRKIEPEVVSEQPSNHIAIINPFSTSEKSNEVNLVTENIKNPFSEKFLRKDSMHSKLESQLNVTDELEKGLEEIKMEKDEKKPAQLQDLIQDEFLVEQIADLDDLTVNESKTSAIGEIDLDAELEQIQEEYDL